MANNPNNPNNIPLGGGNPGDSTGGQTFGDGGDGNNGRGGHSFRGRGANRGNGGGRRKREPASFAASANTTAEAERIIREQFNIGASGS